MATTYESIILVTGGTSGIGYHTALSLAKANSKSQIIVASRTNTDDASRKINTKLNQQNTTFLSLDLSSLASVREFVSRYQTQKLPPIQALVLCAGIQYPGGIEYTSDGIEKHFGVNHVGHALLFHLLIRELRDDARIVIVASSVHDPAQGWKMDPVWTTPADVASPDESSIKKNTGAIRYSTSKLANVLWALALSRHLTTSSPSSLSHSHKTVVSFDPGLVPGTSLAREAGAVTRFVAVKMGPYLVPILKKIMNPNVHSVEESAENLAWVVGSEEVKGKSGVYYEGRKEKQVSVVAGEEGKQEELWEWTVQRIGEGEEEKGRFGRLE